jgi:hypothetical protein
MAEQLYTLFLFQEDEMRTWILQVTYKPRNGLKVTHREKIRTDKGIDYIWGIVKELHNEFSEVIYVKIKRIGE